MKNKMKSLLCLVLCVAMVLSMAACGKSSGGGSGETSQGVTDSEIKIGTIALTSGAYAFVGTPAIAGLKACFDRVNANGGIRGRQIKLISYDDQGDPASAKAYIEKLVEEDEVFMLTNLGSEVEPMMMYLKEYGIPVVSITSTDDSAFENDPNSRIYEVAPSFTVDGEYLAARVLHEDLFGPNGDEKLGPDDKIAVLYTNDQSCLTTLDGLMNQAKKEGAEDRFVPLCWSSGTDVQSMIVQWKNENCKALIMIPYAGEWMIAAMDDAQWEVPFFGSYGISTIANYAPDTYKSTRPIYANIWTDFTTEKGQAILADLADALSYNTDISAAEAAAYVDNNYCVAGYCYGMMICEALERFNENPDLDLTWENLDKLIASEDFYWGDVSYSYANGNRSGITSQAVFEYIGHPESDPMTEEFQIVRGFETIEEIMAK